MMEDIVTLKRPFFLSKQWRNLTVLQKLVLFILVLRVNDNEQQINGFGCPVILHPGEVFVLPGVWAESIGKTNKNEIAKCLYHLAKKGIISRTKKGIGYIVKVHDIEKYRKLQTGLSDK